MTTHATHTPGPWAAFGSTITGKQPVGNRGDYNESPICTVSHFYNNPEVDRANAALIAAAPELLEALKFTMKATANWPGTLSGSIEAIRERATEAITKAEGREP